MRPGSVTDKLALRRLEYEVKDKDAALLEVQEECAALQADRDQYVHRPGVLFLVHLSVLTC